MVSPRDITAGLACGRSSCRCARAAREGKGLTHCPTHGTHGDDGASLSVGDKLGKTVVHCMGGCPQEVVIEGLRARGLWGSNGHRPPARETVYAIRDPKGELLAEHVRREHSDGSKDFYWRRNGKVGLDGLKTSELPLYGVEHLAQKPGRAVVVTEGEKPTDALNARGVLAVGTVTGASAAPGRDSLRALVNRRVVLWPDNDDPGRWHMMRIAKELRALGIRVDWLAWPEAPAAGDAADYLAGNPSADEIRDLLTSARPWNAEPAPERPQPAEQESESCVSESMVTFEQHASDPPAALVTGHNDLGSIAFTHGLPDRLKSWHLYTKVLCVAAGRPFLGQYPVSQGPVILWIEEGARWRISQRIQRLRRGLGIGDEEAASLPIRFIVLRGLRLDRPADVVKLRKELERGSPPVLLGIDNLSRIHTKDENRPSELGPVLATLADLQRDFGCTIDLIHHNRKNLNGAEADIGSNLRGSSDLDAWWRNRSYIERRPDGTVVVKPQSKDGVAAQPYAVHLEDHPDGSIRLVWDGEASKPGEVEIDRLVTSAIRRLGMSATVNNIVKATERGKPAVVRSLRRLVEQGLASTESCLVNGQEGVRYRMQKGGTEEGSE